MASNVALCGMGHHRQANGRQSRPCQVDRRGREGARIEERSQEQVATGREWQRGHIGARGGLDHIIVVGAERTRRDAAPCAVARAQPWYIHQCPPFVARRPPVRRRLVGMRLSADGRQGRGVGRLAGVGRHRIAAQEPVNRGPSDDPSTACPQSGNGSGPEQLARGWARDTEISGKLTEVQPLLTMSCHEGTSCDD
jgi:hypothetical protein